MKTYLFAIALLTTVLAQAQQMGAEEVLAKTVKFHDPNDNWSTFNDSLQVTMTTPNRSERVTDIHINLQEKIFKATASRDGNSTIFHVIKNDCVFSKTDSTKDDEACERAVFMKNYYTYLYGLPMKLNDPNTDLSNRVDEIDFKGKSYLRLQITYQKEIGAEVWYFYIDPTTYAMEVYQFFKTDAAGNIDTATGEYILLSELAEVSGIKMPKIRKWFYNKNDQYLGTDTITN